MLTLSSRHRNQPYVAGLLKRYILQPVETCCLFNTKVKLGTSLYSSHPNPVRPSSHLKGKSGQKKHDKQPEFHAITLNQPHTSSKPSLKTTTPKQLSPNLQPSLDQPQSRPYARRPPSAKKAKLMCGRFACLEKSLQVLSFSVSILDWLKKGLPVLRETHKKRAGSNRRQVDHFFVGLVVGSLAGKKSTSMGLVSVTSGLRVPTIPRWPRWPRWPQWPKWPQNRRGLIPVDKSPTVAQIPPTSQCLSASALGFCARSNGPRSWETRLESIRSCVSSFSGRGTKGR